MNKKSKRGFTLAEAVIACFVVGLGMAGVMSMVFWMVRANGWSGNMTTASTVGQQKLEQLFGMDYAMLADGSDTVDHFTRSWTIGSPSSSNQFKTVTLEVEWTRPNDSKSRVVLSALRSNPVVPGVDLSPFNLGATGGGGGGGAGGGGETGEGSEPPDDGTGYDIGDVVPDGGYLN